MMESIYNIWANKSHVLFLSGNIKDELGHFPQWSNSNLLTPSMSLRVSILFQSLLHLTYSHLEHSDRICFSTEACIKFLKPVPTRMNSKKETWSKLTCRGTFISLVGRLWNCLAARTTFRWFCMGWSLHSNEHFTHLSDDQSNFIFSLSIPLIDQNFCPWTYVDTSYR